MAAGARPLFFPADENEISAPRDDRVGITARGERIVASCHGEFMLPLDYIFITGRAPTRFSRGSWAFNSRLVVWGGTRADLVFASAGLLGDG